MNKSLISIVLTFCALSVSGQSLAKDPSYAKLKTYFEPYFNDNKNKKEKEIPWHIYKYYIPTLMDKNERKVALGVVKDHRGCDLFFVRTEYSYKGTPEEKLYGAGVKTSVDLIVLRDGEQFDEHTLSTDNYNGTLLNYSTLKASYAIPDSLEYSMDYVVNSDTTITLQLYSVELPGLTGYSYPFVKTLHVKYEIDEDGDFVRDVIQKVVFTTPFFSLSDAQKREMSPYPTRDNAYDFVGYSLGLNIQPFYPDSELLFYMDEDTLDPKVDYIHVDSEGVQHDQTFVFGKLIDDEFALGLSDGNRVVVGK